MNRRLDRKMSDAFAAVWDMAQTHRLPLRTAAYMVALKSVTRATMIRGFD